MMRHFLVPMGLGFILLCNPAAAQNPTSCASVGSRANSNGQATNCPNVSGTAMATNFNSTSYATVPSSGKTGNLQLSYTGANASLTPFAITRTWATTTGGVTSLTTVAFGPASPPVVSGGNTQVNYCFYNSNLATVGTLSFEFTDPQTGVVWGICSFDASCTANCTMVANPSGVLPVTFTSFKAMAGQGRSARLEWTTAIEQNNKGYTVERSIDGGAFAPVGFVQTSNPGGNSSTPSRYSFNDLEIPGGHTVGYRLQQEDLDGKLAYSEIQQIQLKDISAPAIYNNGKTIIVDFPAGLTKPQDILVHDSEGRLIRQFHAVAVRQYRITDLPGGHLYYISVREEGAARPTVKSVF
ncbi:MAG: hypothetical protein JST68_12615 [Bacteroidetes bacterium]|nr:hypothetical protein [Bacteroidota bacterium]